MLSFWSPVATHIIILFFFQREGWTDYYSSSQPSFMLVKTCCVSFFQRIVANAGLNACNFKIYWYEGYSCSSNRVHLVHFEFRWMIFLLWYLWLLYACSKKTMLNAKISKHTYVFMGNGAFFFDSSGFRRCCVNILQLFILFFFS